MEISDVVKSLPFKFLLPIVLLALQFSLKYLIDRRATAYNFITSVLEIPVSILFISISLLSAFIIAELYDTKKAFLFVLIILIFLIFCIFFWRRSVDQFEKKNFWISTLLGLLNFIISVPILIYIIYFLISYKK